MRCFIFGAGEYDSRENLRDILKIYGILDEGRKGRKGKPADGEDSLIIAADGGLDHLLRLGVNPDLVVGDFDSLSFDIDHVPEDIKAKAKSWEIVRHPKMKDDTDTMLAIKEGFRRGCRAFYIFGATGGRIDHTMANIQAMSYIVDKGGLCLIHGPSENMGIVKDDELVFPKHFQGYVSVFSLADVSENVCMKGFKYELVDWELSRSFPLGVSNEFAGQEAVVSVGDGELLVIWEKQ